MEEKVKKIASDLKDELKSLSEYIYNNPELGFEEFKSSKAHIDILKKHGFKVEEGYAGIKTAFRAEYDSKKSGPTIAYLSEYDALPGIGHGCGHNILGTTNTGAGIVLSKLLDEIGGKVVVLGTPAEETSGAKVDMVNQGAFDDVDVAMVAHPESRHLKSGASLALNPLQFTFRGKAAHAAAAPEEGINALDAAIITFNGINALREHVLPSTRIHGIIKEGGKAANIVPDLAIAQFYVRSTTKSYMLEVSEKVINCAKAGALATGAKLEITNFENGYDNLVTNETLSDVYTKHIKNMGVENVYEPDFFPGSLDMGNVSHVCPAIHPFFGVCKEGEVLTLHTAEFAKATLTETAYDNMIKTVCALALTGAEIIKDKELLRKIRDEFEKAEK